MGRKKKLIDRFLSRPIDFTYNELTRLMDNYGFKEVQGQGSAVSFVNSKAITLYMHKPHPRKTLLNYEIKKVTKFLAREGLI